VNKSTNFKRLSNGPQNQAGGMVSGAADSYGRVEKITHLRKKGVCREEG